MKLDPSTVGYQTEPYALEYDFRTTVLYALGVGATIDELDYLYEGRGPKVLPSFAVVPSYAPVHELFEKTGSDLSLILHGGQGIRVHRPIPPAGKLSTVGLVRGIYDMKKFAQVVLETHTSLDGEKLFETEWRILVRDSGGFGGPRPPKQDVPKIPKEASPSFVVHAPTSPELALLYRLSGDLNPLHADPQVARAAGFDQGPILHGLASFGIVTRALLRHIGPNRSIRSLTAQFRKPVWPGETLRTEGFQLEGGGFALEAYAADRPEPVITSGFAEVV